MNNEAERDTYLELTVIFMIEYLNREQTDNVSHQEYLITRGLPASLEYHHLRRTRIIQCQLRKTLDDAAIGYLDYLKDIAMIRDWKVEEITIKDEKGDEE